jgi:hypothetical protein
MGPLRQRHDQRGVPAAGLLGLPALLKLLAGVLLDGLQHHEARLSVCSLLPPQEALLEERPHHL